MQKNLFEFLAEAIENGFSIEFGLRATGQLTCHLFPGIYFELEDLDVVKIFSCTEYCACLYLIKLKASNTQGHLIEPWNNY